MTRSPWLRATHLSTLFALAVAQPVLDLLGHNGEFFVARHSSRSDVVLFGMIVCFAVPVLLTVLELGAARLHERAARWIHLALVAVLLAALALLAAKRALPGAAALLVAPILGIAGAALYARFAALQTLLSVLAPAPLLVAAIFVGRAVLAGGAVTVEAANVRVGRPAPVVFLLFDELSGLSLMDEKQQLDADRYPHFAELARQSTWFRNATTVNNHTTIAVPALLTGRYPDKRRLQTAEEYPENLFTLLGGSYRLEAFESVTRMCPAALCAEESAPPPLTARLTGMLADAGVVYGHLLLPEEQAARLPAIDDRWGGFAGGKAVRVGGAELGKAVDPDEKKWRRGRGGAVRKVPTLQGAIDIDRADLFQRFLDSIGDADRPTLYFLHLLIPHTPWRYLPSGRDYASRGYQTLDGVGSGEWLDDEWLVTQGTQRYLLQVGYADHLVGRLLERLRETGLYDRALVAVTADHGVSTVPGEPRRGLGEKGYPELLAVPFFVKVPGQSEAAVSDRNVEIVDMLPTIADALDIDLPWRVDGQSALRAETPERSEKRFASVVTDDEIQWRTFGPTLPERQINLDRLVSMFGTGATRPNGVWAIGPYRDLVGKSVPVDAPTLPGLSLRVDSTPWHRVDLARIVPARVTGGVRGVAGDEPIWVAVGVNGTIAAVTRAGAGGAFSAMISDERMRQGDNQLAAFLIREEEGEIRLYRGG